MRNVEGSFHPSAIDYVCIYLSRTISFIVWNHHILIIFDPAYNNNNNNKMYHLYSLSSLISVLATTSGERDDKGLNYDTFILPPGLVRDDVV